MHQGIIIKGIGGFYYIKSDDGKIYECKARGVFRKQHITPTVGDYVEIDDLRGDKATLSRIIDRKNSLVRPSVANIDIIVIVVAAASPDPSLPLIDKMLVNAELNGITPMICINKIDLAKRDDIVRIYESAGYKVVNVCATSFDDFSELENAIRDKTVAFAGLSGVGKSTILSAITTGEMETGELSEKLARGKHTTRHVELLELKCGGFALDTPGFGQLDVMGTDELGLQDYFPEFAPYKNNCRFRGCVHINEPECAIKAKLESGTISQERYNSYCAFYEELKKIKRY